MERMIKIELTEEEIRIIVEALRESVLDPYVTITEDDFDWVECVFGTMRKLKGMLEEFPDE